jgi:uncharacterized protein
VTIAQPAGHEANCNSVVGQNFLFATTPRSSRQDGLPLSDSQEAALDEKRKLNSSTAGVRVALFLLNCYKAFMSPWLAGNCRFQPTCSRYAYEAIERFGVARGMCLGTTRLLRCHPLSRRFGYDPVPEKCEEMRSDTWDKNLEVGQSEDRPTHAEVRS